MRSVSNSFTSIFYSLGGVLFVIINIWLKNYRNIFLVEIIVLPLVAFNLLFLCRTPFYLHETEQYTALFQVLQYIGWWNNYKENAAKIQNHFINIHTQQQKESNIIADQNEDNNIELKVPHHVYRFTLKSFRKAIYFMVVTGNIYIGYGLSLLIPDKMGIKNIYLNGSLLGVSEMVAAIVSSLIAHKVKRRSLNMFHCYNTIVIAGLLFAINFFTFKESNIGRITESCLSLLVKLTTCISINLIFTYGSELFHTKYRGIIIAIAVFFGNLMISLASYMDTVASRLSIHPMILLSLTSLITVFFILLLPETLNKKISN